MVAHGGTAGLIAESLIAVAVAAVFVAIWLRERRHGEERDLGDGSSPLRDDH